jgi:RNA polymerase sigma-70 factor, ECF subfamily
MAASPPPPDVPPGGGEPAERLFGLLYAELRSLAQSYFRRQPSGQTLQPTALVHEVYLRLAQRDDAGFRGREHFLAVAATAMRQILVDHERARHAQKRGGEATRITITGNFGLANDSSAGSEIDVLALHEALLALAELSPRQARVVELLYFGGLTTAEASVALEVSESLVEKEWRRARAWLRRELSPPHG